LIDECREEEERQSIMNEMINMDDNNQANTLITKTPLNEKTQMELAKIEE
jgi:hypothetical protein